MALSLGQHPVTQPAVKHAMVVETHDIPYKLYKIGFSVMNILRIDTGSLGAHCIQVHTFLTKIVVMVYHTYYERSHFSLFDDIFVILIYLKL